MPCTDIGFCFLTDSYSISASWNQFVIYEQRLALKNTTG
jgi:hypothetical protein